MKQATSEKIGSAVGAGVFWLLMAVIALILLTLVGVIVWGCLALWGLIL